VQTGIVFFISLQVKYLQIRKLDISYPSNKTKIINIRKDVLLMDINLDKDNYSKEEVQELIKGLQGQITDLTGQLEEGNKAVEKVKELEKSNLDNSIKLAMTKAGLDEDLFDLVSAEDIEKAQAKIDKLVELQKAKDVDSGYKPENKRTEDQYKKLEKDGNVEGMLKSKLGRLFG
jgi:hypothetical protein